MKRYLVILLGICCLIFLAGNALAGMVSDFHLKDGSMIRGVIIAHTSRVYSIRTQSIGVLRIHESKIDHISTRSSDAGTPTPTTSSAKKYGGYSQKPSTSAASQAIGMSNTQVAKQSQAMGQKMMQNPEMMNIIGALGADPEFQKILSDPKLMDAVNRGDIQTLMASPEFMNLLSHPGVQQITKMSTE